MSDNITMPREAVEKIHEAWGSEVYPPATSTEWYDIMDALRTALAAEQPKPEPVAWFLPQPLEVHYYSAKNQALQREVEALRRDAERLREALETMLTATTNDGKEQFPGHYSAFLEQVAKPRAKAALRREDEK